VRLSVFSRAESVSAAKLPQRLTRRGHLGWRFHGNRRLLFADSKWGNDMPDGIGNLGARRTALAFSSASDVRM
jgi:hypothetical protein